MLEKSIIPYITKSSMNYMLIAGSAGLIYNYQLEFKQRILLLLQKTSNLSILFYNYYKKLLEFNKKLYYKFLFFLHENKQYKTYGYICLSIIGATSLIFKNSNKLYIPYKSINNFDYKKYKYIL